MSAHGDHSEQGRSLYGWQLIEEMETAAQDAASDAQQAAALALRASALALATGAALRDASLARDAAVQAHSAVMAARRSLLDNETVGDGIASGAAHWRGLQSAADRARSAADRSDDSATVAGRTVATPVAPTGIKLDPADR